MADVRNSIALDEVIVAAERIEGRPDPDEHNRLVRMLDEQEIDSRDYYLRMAAHHLAVLAWAETVGLVGADRG